MLPLSLIFGLTKGHSAGILRHLGRGLQWSVKLHNQISFFISVRSGEHLVCFIVVLLLLLYCSSYSQHIYFSDSYQASRAKDNVAAVQSDINSTYENQTQQNMGKGHIGIRDQENDSPLMNHKISAVVQVLSESTGPLNLKLLLFLQNCLKMLFEQPDKVIMYPGSSFNKTQNTVSRIVSILSCLYRQYLTTAHYLQ
jgi:hypothetical protein